MLKIKTNINNQYCLINNLLVQHSKIKNNVPTSIQIKPKATKILFDFIDKIITWNLCKNTCLIHGVNNSSVFRKFVGDEVKNLLFS